MAQAETTCLYLPSQCVKVVAVPKELTDTERRLRIAQAEDALAELRCLLRISSGLWRYKRTQVGPSQRAGTRAWSLITRFKDKIDRCANRYRAAHQALVELDPEGDWSKRLRKLKLEHVKGPCRDEDEKSEGRRELSWIWIGRPQSERDDPMTLDDKEFGESKLCHLINMADRIEELIDRYLCGMGTVKGTGSSLG